MTKTIYQFMWAFQHTFRMSVQRDVQRVLSQIGLQVHDKVIVLLIGLAARDDVRHKKCIEPEDGPLTVEDLRLVKDRTAEIFGADPASRLHHGDPRHHEKQRRALFIHCRAQAIAEAIQESGKYEGLCFFVSGSAPIEGYEVHTCIGIPNEALDSVPRFNNPIEDDRFGPTLKTHSYMQLSILAFEEQPEPSTFHTQARVYPNWETALTSLEAQPIGLYPV